MSEYLDPFESIDRHGSKLPHWQQEDTMQFVTFRLGDSMPQSKLMQWKEDRKIWLRNHPTPWAPEDESAYHRLFTWKMEEWLDQGEGACVLQDPSIRQIIEETLMFDHEIRAIHEARVIMPNHVHLLFVAKVRIEILLKSWKGISARRIGNGSLWQKGYRDTMIRDARHYENAVRYIRRNPINLPEGTYSLWQSDRALAVL